jgi:uncharacterized membrane protein
MPPTLSTPVAVVMILSLLLGAANQIIQTGALFGAIIPPKAWMPEFVITATFLGGVVSYFSGLSPVVVNATTVFYAIAAGVSNLLVASAPAVVVHAHYVLPAQYKAMRAKMLAPAVPPPSPPPVQT